MNKKTQYVLRLVRRLLVFYAVFCLIIFLIQRSLLYFPSHEEPMSELTPWLDQGNLVGYCREVSQPQTVWFMLHGNAGQASDRDYVLDRLPTSDSLYVMEYPGYGQRPGSPSRVSFDQAALEAYELLTKRFPSTPLCVLGESIGSGPASGLASAPRPPDKIVLVVPYDQLSAVAGRRFFFLPVRWMLLDNWDNIRALQDYRGPVDIFAARDDTLIPCTHAKNLAEHVPQSNYQEVPCGHNGWSRMRQVQIRHEPQTNRSRNLFNIRPTVEGFDADELNDLLSKFVQQQIMGQRDNITERLANRLQDRDQRQGLQAVMEKSREILNQSWGDGSAWRDAKIVISSVRKHLQDNGFSPQSLSHPKIINSMRDIPDDIIKLVGKLASFSTTTEKPKKTNKPARRNKDKQ